MKLLCRILGHRFNYYIARGDGGGDGYSNVRVCARCVTAQEYRGNMPVFGPDWYTLVRMTDKGAAMLLGSIDSIRIARERDKAERGEDKEIGD